MDVKRILLILLLAVAIVASVSAVSAGWFDGLGGTDNSNDDQSESIQMETQYIEGLFKISAPVGSKFENEGIMGDNHYSIKNTGEYDTEVMFIVYTPYEFSSSAPTTTLVEQDGDLEVYEDSNGVGFYMVDRVIDGITISVTGYDLDLLKEMANSVELIN